MKFNLNSKITAAWFAFIVAAQIQAKDGPMIAQAVEDKLLPNPSNQTQLQGYLGQKIDLCITNQIQKRDVAELIRPFQHREKTSGWQSEFWGKWILSAIAGYQYNQDPKLLKIIDGATADLLATQTPDGFIGNYTTEAQLQNWDIWGRKYTLLGLLAYYDLSGDQKALDGAKKLADYLLTQVGPGKVNIIRTGNFRGMPSSSILEPMVQLYRRTGDDRYFTFCKYIVQQWETEEGPKLIGKALAGVAVADRFPRPKDWWTWENGQKAYEMMSCYEGLLDLYRLTGEPSYLKATELAVSNIIATEINVAGSGTAFECFYHGTRRQTDPSYHTMETCVTLTWMKLCHNLLQLTGNPMYADQIESSTYNALLAAMKEDGSHIAKYSPLEGRRQEGEKQCGMNINCCSANGPRAFTMLPKLAVEFNHDAIFVNLYGQSTATVAVEASNRVTVKQTTDYPRGDEIQISVNPEKPATFDLNLRIPAWSKQSSVYVNGVQLIATAPGTYQKISREWKRGDQVTLKLDLSGRLVTVNGYQAIMRGPILLARDTRFEDGYVDEAAVVAHKDRQVSLSVATNKPPDIWIAYTAPMVLGTDLEGEDRSPKQIGFCDFASAGDTWNPKVRYRVWIKQTLHEMKGEPTFH